MHVSIANGCIDSFTFHKLQIFALCSTMESTAQQTFSNTPHPYDGGALLNVHRTQRVTASRSIPSSIPSAKLITHTIVLKELTSIVMSPISRLQAEAGSFAMQPAVGQSVAIVTGASSGIGWQTMCLLAEQSTYPYVSTRLQMSEGLCVGFA